MRKASLACLLISLMVLPLWGFTVRKGESVNIGAGEIINDDVLLLARDIDIKGTVNGDVYAFGQTITVSGPVSGTVISAGQQVDLKSPQLNTAWAAGAKVNAAGNVNGNLIIMGRTLVLEKDGVVKRDLRAYGGNLDIDGEIKGVVVGGVGDFIMSGKSGSIYIDAENVVVKKTAQVNGEIKIESENDPVIEDGSTITGNVRVQKQESDGGNKAFFAIIPFFAFLIGIFRVLMFFAKLLTGVILIALAANYVRRIMVSLKTKTWHCLGWGFVGMLVIPVVGMVLLLTLIGMPLAVLTCYIFSILLYLSSIMVALVLGELILGLFKKKGNISLYLSLIIGQIFLFLICLIPIIGFLMRIAVIIFGSGMLLHGTWQCLRESREKGLI